VSEPSTDLDRWVRQRVRADQIERYLDAGRDFIPEAELERLLARSSPPDPVRVREILDKSRRIETLTAEETAVLIAVADPALREEMYRAALEVKLKVYDNRIVTFAPLYTGSLCVNDCAYCGFRSGNRSLGRDLLSMDRIRAEVEILAGTIGHKRLILVYGEHPRSGIEYMADSIAAVYGVRVPTAHGFNNIRRVNVNAPVMPVEELKLLHEAGIGTYQVFQETYHRPTFEKLHPRRTIKGDYRWRLYCMHRAFEAGIDDVGIGALFGLHDWRYEVLGLVCHARELEERFGIGPHTVSFPRLQPSLNSTLAQDSPWKVSDEDFLHLVAVIRLAVPYTGMIITARENAGIRRASVALGITQTDASTRIGIGGYGDGALPQSSSGQQFLLGDTRSLDEFIRELAESGYVTSFCTAGYRCGRTGKKIMDLLRSGREGRFCKLNAVLTFREWLDDFGSPATRAAAEPLIRREIEEIAGLPGAAARRFPEYYERTARGERDLYF